MTDFGYVEIMHVRAHQPVKPATWKPEQKNRWRCQQCGRGPFTAPHRGYPRSMNVLGSGNRGAFYSAKKMWQARYTELLEDSPLPRPMEAVQVEGLICKPTRGAADQGNLRFMIEKALGDALVEGGWLVSDDWSRFEFGNLRRVYRKGEAYTLLRLWPQDEVLPDVAPGWDVAPMSGQQVLAVPA